MIKIFSIVGDSILLTVHKLIDTMFEKFWAPRGQEQSDLILTLIGRGGFWTRKKVLTRLNKLKSVGRMSGLKMV